ncbi:MAG: transposase, partial [Prevotella sp.]|nr:transposase [Prevotella sp.]
MSKRTVKRRQFSMDFKLQLLKEYYESGSSMYKISKKYGIDDVTFYRWVRSFESKGLSLPSELNELEKQV